MKRLSIAILGAACVAALTATAASAEIACNREGECWHIKGKYEHRPEWGLVIHPDSWKWAEHEKYKWREHEGRGYWRNGAWVEF